jgi:hypothetical protein
MRDNTVESDYKFNTPAYLRVFRTSGTKNGTFSLCRLLPINYNSSKMVLHRLAASCDL